MKIYENEKFENKFKKLIKKYSSLKDDFENLKEIITKIPKGDGTKHWNHLKSDFENEKFIFKVRLKCKSTRSSRFRIIYFYDGKNIELFFIEIYFKGKKESEDKKLVEDFWKLKNK